MLFKESYKVIKLKVYKAVKNSEANHVLNKKKKNGSLTFDKNFITLLTL